MEHDRAVETQAVERYLLGEMLQEERDAFEEHYFACPECARDIRAGARFRANAREVLRDPQRFDAAGKRSGFSAWWRWPTLAPLAASVFLLGVVVYQAGFEIPSLRRQAAVLPVEGATSITLRDTTRGADTASIPQISKDAGVVSLHFDILTEEKAPRYECSIADASGKVIAVTGLTPPAGDEPATLNLRPGLFTPGRYRVTVRSLTAGGPGNPFAKYEFEIH